MFHDDWRRYPTAIVHTDTKNKSFLRLAQVYRAMGITNHAFPLALINPELRDIDPFDPDLTLDQKAAITQECKINPWYFLREVARVPGEGNAVAVPFEANRANIAIWWCFFNHITTFLIQPRQTGKSFAIDTLDVMLTNITCERTKINLLTKDETLRKKNIQQIKDIAAELPDYLQRKQKDDISNTEELTIKALGNRYTAHVPQPSEKRAYNTGRGLVTTVIRGDELPFQQNIHIALPALLAATGAAFDQAKAAGVPYGITFTTTAGKKDDKEGAYVYKLLSESAVWTEKFFDCKNLEELERSVKINSRGGVCRINITMNHRQLGKTDEWLKMKIDTATASGEDADRDYFNIWTAGSQTNPIDPKTLERIVKSECTDVYHDISPKYGYITRWFIPEETIAHRLTNSKIVIGSDPSDAGGGDDISLVFLDIETLEVIAAGTYNETNLYLFAEWVCSIVVSFPNTTLIVERRSSGASLLDFLLLMLPRHGIDPFKRLFNLAVNEYDEFPDRWKEATMPMDRRDHHFYARYKRLFGFATSGSGYACRSDLYSKTLKLAAKRSCDLVKDKQLIDQIKGLINKNGRIDHPTGEHDDLVIGWLLAHWLITQGKNLEHYGIDSRAIRAKSAEIDDSLDSSFGNETRREQQGIRSRMDELYDLLKNESDDIICSRYEQELRMLDKKVILEEGEIYSIDALIKDIAETKRRKRRSYEYTSEDNPLLYNGYYGQHAVMSDRPLGINDFIRGH